MKHYAASLDRWELLEFSQLGFIGQIPESIYSIYRLKVYTEFNIRSILAQGGQIHRFNGFEN